MAAVSRTKRKPARRTAFVDRPRSGQPVPGCRRSPIESSPRRRWSAPPPCPKAPRRSGARCGRKTSSCSTPAGAAPRQGDVCQQLLVFAVLGERDLHRLLVDVHVPGDGADQIVFQRLQPPGREAGPIVDLYHLQALFGLMGRPALTAAQPIQDDHPRPPSRTRREIRRMKPLGDSRASRGISSPIRRWAISRKAFPALLRGFSATGKPWLEAVITPSSSGTTPIRSMASTSSTSAVLSISPRRTT